MVSDQAISNVAVPLSLMRRSSSFQGVEMDDCLFGDLQVRNGQIVGMSRLKANACLLYTSPSPRDLSTSRMPSSA